MVSLVRVLPSLRLGTAAALAVALTPPVPITAEPGQFEVLAGASSRDRRLMGAFAPEK